MKKLLLLIIICLSLSSCNNSRMNQEDSSDVQLTFAQLDSIRHKQVNDSINSLDTIKIMKVLFMGMTPEEYKDSTKQYSTLLKIGRLKYWHPDTLIYHNTVHDILLKANDEEVAYDLDDMKYKVISGEETFNEVIKTLSAKYGFPSYKHPLPEINENGFQYGYAIWNFDKFSVEYHHKQWANLRNNRHRIQAQIKYSIPRIPTKEEKFRSDSIINEMNKREALEKQRNDEAIRGL